MHVSVMNRESFLGWLGGERVPSKSSARGLERGLKPGSIVAIWKERGSIGTPDGATLAVRREELADFFAFVSTYVSTYRPFTAFFRVIEVELMKEFETACESLSPHREAIAKIACGMSIVENYLRSPQPERAGGQSFRGLTSSLSALIGRAVIAGYGEQSLNTAIKRWGRLQTPITTDSLVQLSEIVPPVWAIVTSAVSGMLQPGMRMDDALFLGDALAEIVFQGAPSETTLHRLESRFDFLQGLRPRMSGPREDRVRFFNQVTPKLLDASGDGQVGAFAAGLLISMVGNGSFDHLSLGEAVAKRVPAGLFWFGVVAALHPDSNIFTLKGGIAHRCFRDLLRPVDLFGPSRSDISAAELTVALRSRGSLGDIPSLVGNGILAEVLPGVEMVVNLDSSSGAGEVERFTVTSEELRELQFLLERARRLTAQFGNNKQRDLFGNDSKNRRGR